MAALDAAVLRLEPRRRRSNLLLVEEAEPTGQRVEPPERVVLPEQHPELRPRGEEPVRLVHPAVYQVVHQHADHRLVPGEHHLLTTPAERGPH